MTITRDNQQSTSTTTGATSFTYSYTVNSGSNRLLVVTAHFMRNSTTDYTTSATWDGNAMSKAAEATATSTNRRTRVVVFYTIAPDVKTADIVLSTGGATMAGFGIGAVTLQGAKQSSPVGSTTTDTTNPAASLALTGLTSGSMVYALAGSDSGSTPTWTWSTATEAYDFNNGNDNAEVAGSGGYFAVPSSGNHTLTATRSSSGAHHAAAAAEFFEAAAATHSVRLVNPRGRLVVNTGGTLA